MTIVAIIVETVAISLLYKTAKSQARLIEAIARFDKKFSTDYPYGAREATLSQIVDAHKQYQGFGETGEFTLSRKEGNQIIFLLNHRHLDLDNPQPVPLDSNLAEPMRLALSGQSGTIIGLDYRGEKVLAAFEPVAELDLGIVAKIDIAEIRRPFFKAAIYSGLIGLAALLVGAAFFIRVTNPLLTKLHKTIDELKAAMNKVKVLSGFLPICASCKKIRDDNGYWNNIEEYIRERSEAEFSHGICPDCAQKLYPNLKSQKSSKGKPA
jgi:hypothetical protein